MAAPANTHKASFLVVASPDAPELEVLKELPPGVRVVAIGRELHEFAALTDEDWDSINVVLNCGFGAQAGTRAHVQVCVRAEGLTVHKVNKDKDNKDDDDDNHNVIIT